jgi:hypothetical protein
VEQVGAQRDRSTDVVRDDMRPFQRPMGQQRAEHLALGAQ